MAEVAIYRRVTTPHTQEIIEEFSLEMPQRVLPEKRQWHYRLLMSCSAFSASARETSRPK